MVTGDVDADAVVDVTVCVDAGTEDVVEVIVDVCTGEVVVFVVLVVTLEEVVVPVLVPVALELEVVAEPVVEEEVVVEPTRAALTWMVVAPLFHGPPAERRTPLVADPPEAKVAVRSGPVPPLSVALVHEDGGTLHVYALMAVLFHKYASTRYIGTGLASALGDPPAVIVSSDCPHPLPLTTSS